MEEETWLQESYEILSMGQAITLPKFIYVHIMKTAGTSFRFDIIKRFYWNICVYDKTFRIIDEEEKKRRREERDLLLDFSIEKYPPGYEDAHVIFGHFKIEKYDHMNLPYVTFLRDPVERIISQYFYLRSYYGEITIRDFSDIYPNHMTYILGSDLNKLDFVGVVEYYQESIKLFLNKFNLKGSGRYRIGKRRRINRRISKSKKPVSQEDREYIKALNEEDYKLYNEALKRYK